MSFLNRRKPLASVVTRGSHNTLKPSLSWPHLIGLGVGGIVGTGIYTLTGIGAGLAGPGVVLSFVIAGIVCACAALAYAEMATMMPMAGSAYTYSYVALGELLAWIVGWALILEYTVVCSAVAVGWSGYAAGFLKSAGIELPAALMAGPNAGGIVNLPAIVISLGVAAALAFGMRESATVNLLLVVIKVLALVAFIALALPAFDAANFEPFAPFGYGSHVDDDGVKRGIMAAAAIIFFAFYGFDAVSTAAEEAHRPERDLKIGIVGSMLVCTLLYMAVAGAALGGADYRALAASNEPLAMVLRSLGHPLAATLIAGVAVVALPTVIMAFMYGQSRVFFVMARDGLLPQHLSAVHPRFGTPVMMTLVTGVIVAAIAAFLPLQRIVELANAGTLIAFIAVAVCMLVLRIQAPSQPRLFRAPWPWIIGPLAIVGCIYLFTSLPLQTINLFFVWMAIGLVVYFLYARHRSVLATAPLALLAATFVPPPANAADAPLGRIGHHAVIEDDFVYARAGDIELRAHSFRPKADGRVPAIIDIHGGAWSSGDRMLGQLYDRALASAGLFVLAIDFRQAPNARHPAASQDIAAAIRYLRLHAGRLNIDAQSIGLVGSSSGGHLAMLAGTTPQNAEFRGTLVADAGGFVASDLDTAVRYVIALWPVSDPAYRYEYAQRVGRTELMRSHDSYFGTREIMRQASVPRLVRAKEAQQLPPLMVVQPGNDANIPREMTFDLINAYQDAGGRVTYEFYPNQPHAFGHRPSPDTDHLIVAMRDFVAGVLGSRIGDQ